MAPPDVRPLVQRVAVGTRPHQMAVFGEVAQLVASGAPSARVQASFDVREIKAAATLAISAERDGKVVIVPRAVPS